MELVSFWIIVSTSILSIPSYNDTFTETIQRIELPIPHTDEKQCKKIAAGMFKSMKQSEDKNSASKLQSVKCEERFTFIQNERNLQNRTP